MKDDTWMNNPGEDIWDYRSLRGEEFSPLSPEEEGEILLKAKAGDKRAKDRLIKSNVRFVVSKAKAFSRNSGVPVEDLISEGILALYKAFEKFNPRKKVRFLSYATPYVENAMYKYIKSYKALTHMPSISRKDILKITALYQKLGREPTVEEISRELGYSGKKVKEIMDAIRRKVYRIEGAGMEDNDASGETFIADVSTPPDTLEEEYMNMRISEIITELMEELFEGNILNEKEKEVLWKHIFKNMNLSEIAREMGYSREYVRQIKESARKKLLKKFPKFKGLL